MVSLFVAPAVSLLTSFLGVVFLLSGVRKPAQKSMSVIIGGCAGVMLGASFFSLIAPAVAMPPPEFSFPAVIIDMLSIVCGAILMLSIHSFVPHIHMTKGPESVSKTVLESKAFNRVVLITTAVALHNVPEGFALGVGVQSAEWLALLWGIGIQNIPEGAIIAISVRTLSGNTKAAVAATFAAAFAESLSALLGGIIGSSHDLIIRYALLFAAGTMIYVVSQEMIPESHREGNEGLATMSLIFGVIFMLGLSHI